MELTIRRPPDKCEQQNAHKLLLSTPTPAITKTKATTTTNKQRTKFSLVTLIYFYVAFSITLPFCAGSRWLSSSRKLNDNNIIKHIASVSPKLLQRQSFREIKDEFNKSKLLFSCNDKIKVQLSAFHTSFVMELKKNKRLISDKYFESRRCLDFGNNHTTNSSLELLCMQSQIDSKNKIDSNSMFLNLQNFTSNNDHCHYNGQINGQIKSVAAISIVDNDWRMLSGFFRYNNKLYYLDSNRANRSTNIWTPLDRYSFKQEDERSISRHKRSSTPDSDNHIFHYPQGSNSSSLYVELLVVHDHSQYLEFKGNETEIADRTMQIVNIMNAFYRELNIFITLVGVVLWNKQDEIKLTDDGDATLTNFLKYRYEKLLPKYQHDNAQLITKTSFNGSVVGKALKGPICTHEHSGGVNTDHSNSAAVVAVTLAHELGHNLGMEHDDDDKCKCPDEKCIMSSSSNAVHPKHWSSCSISYLNDARQHGLLNCLENEPEKNFGPVCGNGFVEEGEDCDPGEPLPNYGTSKSRNGNQRCKNSRDCEQFVQLNPCCDRLTCKFAKNATCANGPCCDLTKCSVYNATDNKVCRQRQSECDFEEVCDGRNEYCPLDAHFHDGLDCGSGLISSDVAVNSLHYNRSRAFCYRGKCASHQSQCQLLWGSAARVSRNICFDQNTHGNTSGNCGFERDIKSYVGCDHEDALCGMLHCIHNQQGDLRRTGKLGYGFESASTLTVSFFTSSGRPEIYCHGAVIDAGPSVRDPGLVPNGAACGDSRMCLNQRCTPVSQVLSQDWCSSDCNGNGICDNFGVCHCNDGSIGSSCYLFFGLNFQISMIFYMILFFVPILSMIVLTINHYRPKIKIWWYVQNRKIALRNKADETSTAQRRYVPRDLHITRPIQLIVRSNNQQHHVTNANGILDADPWADHQQHAPSMAQLGAIAGVTEPLTAGAPVVGFRLEPLQPPVNNRVSNHHKPLPPPPSSTDLRPVRPAPLPPPPPPPVPKHRGSHPHQHQQDRR